MDAFPRRQELGDLRRAAVRDDAGVEVMERFGLAAVVALGVARCMRGGQVEASQQVEKLADRRGDVGIGIEVKRPVEGVRPMLRILSI